MGCKTGRSLAYQVLLRVCSSRGTRSMVSSIMANPLHDAVVAHSPQPCLFKASSEESLIMQAEVVQPTYVVL